MQMRPTVAIVLAAALTAAAGPARAQTPAAPDSGLGGFLGSFADSTDRYFGLSAAPVDTAGLDTVLFDSALRPRRRLELGVAPAFDFSRVDGSVPGLSATFGAAAPDPERNGPGRLKATIARATGPGVTLGGGRYTNRVRIARQPLDVDLWGGRRTSDLDRDDQAGLLPMARALLSGSDWTQYLREDGFAGALALRRGWWRVRAGYDDLLQSPQRTTTTWNLLGHALGRPGNLAAAPGRMRELDYAAAAHWPRLPLHTELAYQTSSRRLGSDFEYRRLRAAAALDLSLGRAASLVPQFLYGRLTGDPVPQAAFYLGGGSTLRSRHLDELGGSGVALAKVDLVGAQDLLALLRVPHPAALPLQGGLFAATSAVWGRDPSTGAVRRGVDWPDRRDWTSEAGAALIYSSAIFPQRSSLRVSCAWPVGPFAGASRWRISFTRAFDLLGPEPGDDE